MSSLRQNANFETEAVGEQRIGPHEQCVEVGHVIGSIDYGCGQPCCSMCNEDIVLYLDCHHVHLRNHFKIETEKSS